jgi:hypothetical protein
MKEVYHFIKIAKIKIKIINIKINGNEGINIILFSLYACKSIYWFAYTGFRKLIIIKVSS